MKRKSIQFCPSYVWDRTVGGKLSVQCPYNNGPRSLGHQQMRILRVAQKIYPDVKGGAPYHVHAMSRDQAEMGHNVTVLTLRHDPTLPHIEEQEGYTLVRYDPTVTLLGNDISTGVAQHLRNVEDFDVIHAHSHIYFSTNLAALKRRVGDIPLAITNHGLYSQTVSEELFRWYLKTLGRWTFNQADLVFCYTDTDRERLRELGVTTRIEVVPNGIDTDRFTPEGPESDRIDSDGPVVLFVGRLVEGKRPQVALEAVELVRESYPDITLYFCGEGSLREELEREAGAQLGEDVVFLDHVPYDDMPKIYRSADVLVLPSRAEGMPRTVLEALATEVRVVASSLSPVDSLISSNRGGKIVNVDDAEGFANAIIDSLSSKKKKGKTPKWDKSHNWDHTVNKQLKGIRTILG